VGGTAMEVAVLGKTNRYPEPEALKPRGLRLKFFAFWANLRGTT
jgi:hypothetical protein